MLEREGLGESETVKRPVWLPREGEMRGHGMGCKGRQGSGVVGLDRALVSVSALTRAFLWLMSLPERNHYRLRGLSG